jgi:hypothetical protein
VIIKDNTDTFSATENVLIVIFKRSIFFNRIFFRMRTVERCRYFRRIRHSRCCCIHCGVRHLNSIYVWKCTCLGFFLQLVTVKSKIKANNTIDLIKLNLCVYSKVELSEILFYDLSHVSSIESSCLQISRNYPFPFFSVF